mmetsp:Transcript_10127/g.29048  ORF Transcript_10127/g.29048 Transcript_10127/m.29048 type:complete len:1075 (-) Transcript_10127:62-3286(-)
MASAKKRITVQGIGGGGNRITVMCASTMLETKILIGTKLCYANPAICRVFNKFGGEIDDLEVILPEDFLFATNGEPLPAKALEQFHGPFLQQAAVPPGIASTVTPFAASTIAGDGDAPSGKGEFFDICKVLGTGGQGTTYLTTDRRSDSHAVLKQIFCSSLTETNKAIEEAMMLSRLKHPRVVSYSEVFLGKDPAKGNYVGIVMEYCAGGDLYQMLCKQRLKKKPISVRRVKMWILQLSEALAYLHMMKVIHRDVKPMNVLVDSEGDLKMADFGLARQGVSPSRLAMTQCGTPGYESPEVQMGQGYDFKTDIWGLGCVVCDMTTLKFMHERPGSLATQVQVDPKAIVKVIQSAMELYGPDIHSLLASMLQADPKRRPAASEILQLKFLRSSAPAPEADAPAAPPSGSPPPPKTPTGASHRASPHCTSGGDGTDEGRCRSDAPTLVPAGRRPPVCENAAWEDGSNDIRSSPAEGSGTLRRSGSGRQASAPRDSPAGHLGAERRPESAERRASERAELRGELTVSELGQHLPSPQPHVRSADARPDADGAVDRQGVHTGSSDGRTELWSGAAQATENSSRVLIVSKRGAGDFASIADAVRAASDGDTVEIMEGKYQEELVVDKQLTLRAGRGPGDAICAVELEGWSARPVVSCRSRSCELRGLRLLHLAKVMSEGRECSRCVDVGTGEVLMQDCFVTSRCGVGVVVRDGARLEARGCKVVQCGQNGLFLFARGGGLVEDCDVVDNAFPGIGMDQSVDTVIRRCRIHRGRGDGVKIYGGRGIVLEDNDVAHNAQVGVSLEDRAEAVVRRNKVHHGRSCGISVLGSSGGLIQDNDIFANAHPNVYISTCARPVVRGNRIYSSGSCGVTCVDEGLGTIEDNDIYDNQSVGVYIMNRADPVVRNNTVRDGHSDGVAIVFAGRGTIESNRIENNSGMGVLVESEADPRVVANTISRCRGDGIRVCDNGRGVVEGNTVETAGGSGLVVTRGSNPTLRNNAVRDCLGHGIVVSGGACPVVEANVVALCRQNGMVISRQADPMVRANLIRDNAGVGVWIGSGGRGTLCDNRLQVPSDGVSVLTE